MKLRLKQTLKEKMMKTIEKISRTVDRVISGSIGKQLLFFLIIVVAIFAVLLFARVFFFASDWPDATFNDRFWTTVLDFIDAGDAFDQPSNSERVTVLITNLFGMVLFAGVLIALLTNTIYQRIEKVKKGEVYYNFSGHIVIIGCDHICGSLA